MHTRRDVTSVLRTECSNWYLAGPYNTIRDRFGIGILTKKLEYLFNCSSDAKGDINSDEYDVTNGKLYRFGSPVYLKWKNKQIKIQIRGR